MEIEKKERKISVAIDGPSGAGKSTLARAAAKELDFLYVDTGAMYRALAYHFLSCGIAPENGEAVAAACKGADVTIAYADGEQQVFLNGENVSGKIRTEEVGNMTSAVSVYPAVRAKLVEIQREIAAKSDVIMDGRDIGTCVLPGAQVKIYLTAGTATRAKRRYDELTAKGLLLLGLVIVQALCTYFYDYQGHYLGAKIERDIEDRDYRDMHREVSPLRQADDAVMIDSSQMGIDEVVAAIREVYEGVCGR